MPTTPGPHKPLGILLIAAGLIGLLAGIIPFAVNLTTILLHTGPSPASRDLAAHWVRTLGLSPEWALLSSAMGALLGALMIWSGRAWIKRRPSAPLLTFLYVIAGTAVNATDILIFAFRALPGPHRDRMLFLDSIALLIPILLGLWLLHWRRAQAPG